MKFAHMTGTSNGAMKFTPEGGLAIRYVNKTGAASIKGELVHPSTTHDFAVERTGTTEFDPIGAVYESGVADGAMMWVVVAGNADVLLQDLHASTRSDFVNTSTSQAGRCVTSAIPDGNAFGTVNNHFREIGHCLQSVTGGTNKTVRINMHFN